MSRCDKYYFSVLKKMRDNARRKRNRKNRLRKALSLETPEKTRKELITEELKYQKMVRQEHKKYTQMRRKELREAKKSLYLSPPMSYARETCKNSESLKGSHVSRLDPPKELHPLVSNEYEVIEITESAAQEAPTGWKNWIFGRWL